MRKLTKKFKVRMKNYDYIILTWNDNIIYYNNNPLKKIKKTKSIKMKVKKTEEIIKFKEEIVREFDGTFSGDVYESPNRKFMLDLSRLSNSTLKDIGVYCEDSYLFPEFQHDAPANRCKMVYMSPTEFKEILRKKKGFL